MDKDADESKERSSDTPDISRDPEADLWKFVEYDSADAACVGRLFDVLVVRTFPMVCPDDKIKGRLSGPSIKEALMLSVRRE